MVDFIAATIIIALLASWIILFIGKTGTREYIQVHSPKLISQMFSCDFCLSWWLCLIWAVLFSLEAGNPVLLLTSFCATPIARHIL